MGSNKWIVIVLGLGLVLAGSRIALAADAGGGAITGKVILKGKAPENKKLPVSADPAVCGSEHQVEEVVVGADQGVKYAVVHLIGAPAGGPEPPKSADVEQKGCRFKPHVVVMGKGGDLNLLNNDGILHNLHSRSSINPSFNKAQPAFRKKLTQKLDQVEIVKLTCDVHTWMAAWIIVTENGYVAVTDDAGSFKLPNVPPGNYKLEVWHEKLGKQTRDVTVKAGADSSVTFELASS